jgi:hypothetical protein
MELITQEEIEKIKSNITELSRHNMKTIIPYQIKSEYKIVYSIDILPDKKQHHISISKLDKHSDPADEEEIITKLIGKGFTSMGSFFNKNVNHYIKEVKE